MARRSSMTLYSHPSMVHSHRVRLIMAEKGIASYDIIDAHVDGPSEDLLDLNPYDTVPTLVDRELVVHDARNIIEYLDERYPHPPLLPVDPMTRAQYRVAAWRMEMDLYSLCDELEGGSAATRRARKRLCEALTVLASGFTARPWIGEDFSLLDCTLAPVLWRLAHYRISLPERHADTLLAYAARVFARPAFKVSLSAREADMAPVLS